MNIQPVFSKKWTLIAVLVLSTSLFVPFCWGISMEAAANSDVSQPSNRAQRGLRGPVQVCIEETSFSDANQENGAQISERKLWNRTEYDARGRLVSESWRNPDGSTWTTNYTYGPYGLALRTFRGTKGDAGGETAYQYDDHGRLLSITDSQHPETPVIFRYDENGRKTRVQTSRAEDYRPNVAAAGSRFMAAAPPNLPGGGSATTTYDQQARPIEAEIRDAKGEIISRTVRTYDDKGHVLEEKEILEDPLKLIPTDMQAKVQQTSGASLDDLREQLAQLMGNQSSMYSVTNSYDPQGQVSKTIRRFFNMEDQSEKTYNEHGDLASEITRTREIGEHRPGSPPPSYSEAKISYIYDQNGNWTEKATVYRSSPDGEFKTSAKESQTLTYF